MRMARVMAVRGLPRIFLVTIITATLFIFMYKLSSKTKNTESLTPDHVYSRSLNENEKVSTIYRDNKQDDKLQIPPHIPRDNPARDEVQVRQPKLKFDSPLIDERMVDQSEKENSQQLLNHEDERSILKIDNTLKSPNVEAPLGIAQGAFPDKAEREEDGDPEKTPWEAPHGEIRSAEMLMKEKQKKKEGNTTTDLPTTPLKDYINMHYPDFPYPKQKAKCKPLLGGEREFSAVIYFTSRIESYLTQTVLSILDFSSKYNTKLNDIVLTYNTEGFINPQAEGIVEYIEKAVNGRCKLVVTEGRGEWEAKKEGLEAAMSDTVLVVDDMFIVMETAVEHLIDRLDKNRKVIIYPHIDSMLPVRIYFSEKEGNLYPDNLIWQENYDNVYSLDDQFNFKRYERRKIRTEEVAIAISSAAFTGEIFMADKNHILKLLHLSQTKTPVELSILAWLCGEGIKVTKCAAAVKSNNYEMEVPVTGEEQRTRLSKIYRRRQTDAIQKPSLEEDLKSHQCLDSWTGYFRDARDKIYKNGKNILVTKTT